MSITVPDGALVVQDPSEERVYEFDWGTYVLASGVTIATSSWTITAERPSGDTALTKDQESTLSGSRSTSVRLSDGTAGAIYRVANRIVTSESPAQTFERSFLVKVQDR